MKILEVTVNENDIEIIKETKVNKGEYNLSKCLFYFDENYSSGLIKKAVFTGINNKSYEVLIENNQCNIPQEVLTTEQFVKLGVYAYKIRDNKLEIRFSPEPTAFEIKRGSYDDGILESKEITPTQFEQYENALNDGLNEVREELKEVQQIGQVVSEKGTEAEKQGNYAKKIADIVQEKLDNGDFIGPQGKQGIQGEKGEPGDMPDMTNYYNKTEIDNKIGTIDEILDKINGEVIE